MKRLFFILTLLLLSVGAPTHVSAINEASSYDATATTDYSSQCVEGSYYCSCTNSTDDVTDAHSTIPTTAEQCNAYCFGVHTDTYTETCTLSTGAAGYQFGQGTVTAPVVTEESAPASTEAVKDPIVPILNIPIPGFSGFSTPTTANGYTSSSFIAEYINAVYGWVLGAAALIAVVMMMIGGLQYVLARGKPKYITKAKTRITNAITGVILLLIVYDLAYLMNPNITLLTNLNVLTVQQIPDDNLVEFGEGDEADPNGNFFGVYPWQDCMLKTFGATKSEVEQQLTSVKYNGRTYEVHKLIATDMQGAFDEITAENISYNITSIGITNWRSNRNNAKALSFHSWGGALDINPDTNPNCANGTTCSYDMPQAVVDAFEHHNFTWGGHWKHNKDYMHFSTNKFCGGSR